ncbi:MAG TPA: alpha/beta hydrolase-fold protein [Candidatus Limnocylindria bacterium]|nr:alpha/beta hydrolase-fold protein [Candidatus Limnocylindria bacterium]
MKRNAAVAVALCLALALAGVSARAQDTSQAGGTVPIPKEYFQRAQRRGSIVRIEYDSVDYAGRGQPIVKPAYVYLPYGYDEADAGTRYDVLYLMHGQNGTAEDTFRVNDRALPNILDNMIMRGDIRPIIVVSPTFDARNRPQNFSTSYRELMEFHSDLANHLIPAVEGRFRTYAETLDRAGIAASRDHRAFGGFSLGAVTTWQQFVHNLDLIRYFLAMSGDSWVLERRGGRTKPMETARYLAGVAEAHGLEFFIYAATGTRDTLFEQVDRQLRAMLGMPDVFGPGRLAYHVKPGGRHTHEAAQEYIYNALPLFFGP